ncbi:hypothetical protein [Haliangium ochraceum]|uniref:Uncharacterized protein n=1 Tax=Haliangium ochraceum (strain DSM 14365 / JCM 11303 / SMP-2) TaxID=502025 RepID=D0LQC3_HALO1|nr:hypothetical protein [Haliangium ochraceum]ACY18932.1 hypothetical protein Hoch_6463 [Haliangium ochraceum DSM 14365]
MRFSLKQTSARAFDLSLPDEQGHTRKLGFENIADLGGAVEINESAVLVEQASARQAQLASALWELTQGSISAESAVTVSELFVDGQIPKASAEALPLLGRVALKRLSTDALILDGFMPRLAVGLAVEGLDLEQRAEGGQVVANALEVRTLETILGDFLLRAETVRAESAAARWGDAASAAQVAETEADTKAVDIDAGLLKANGLSARSRSIELDGDELRIHDISVRGSMYTVSKLEADKLSCTIDLTAAPVDGDEVSAEKPAAPPPPKAKPSGKPNPFVIDWRLLDRVDGELDVDATVDVHLPVIRRRKATHCFRVPIERGILNYRQLESGLSMLENAVIDFELRKNKLVIERDLPIIRMRKNLVEWDLDAEGVALAKQRRVRLRTLPHYRIVSSGDNKGGGGGDVKLQGLDLDNLRIEFSATKPTAPAKAQVVSLEGGAAPAAAPAAPAAPAAVNGPQPQFEGVLSDFLLTRLSIGGELHYPDGQGILNIKIKQLLTGLRGLRVGDLRIDVGAVRLEALEDGKVHFDGMKPTKITLTLRGLALENVVVEKLPGDAAEGAAAPKRAPSQS